MLIFMRAGAGPITTEQPPNNDSPSQTNEGLVAGVSITVILLFVVSVTVVCMYVLWLRKTTKGIIIVTIA